MTELAPAQAGAVERQEHRAVIEVLRAGNEPADLLGTQHGRESPVTLRGRQLLPQGAPFQDPDKKEAERRHVEAHGADRELPFLKQIGLIPPELTWPEPIEATTGMLAATGVERVQVG